MPPRLVLLGVEAGQPEQAMAVMARLDDLRIEAQAIAAAASRHQLDLLDVEAELVQPLAAARRPGSARPARRLPRA